MMDAEAGAGDFLQPLMRLGRISPEDAIAAGRQLLQLKETTPHGTLTQAIDQLGLAYKTANRYMIAARRFGHLPSEVIALFGNVSRMDMFTDFSEAELDAFVAGAKVRGVELNSLREMSSEQLRDALGVEPSSAQNSEKNAVVKMMVGAVPKPPVAPGSSELEREKSYCRQLAVVIARYSDSEDVAELKNALLRQKDRILQRRYCPGLNDAAYDVYASIMLRRKASEKGE